MSDDSRVVSRIRDSENRNCIQFFRELILNEIPEDIYCYIAGGAIRDYFFNDKKIRNDVDIYFKDEENYCNFYLFFIDKGIYPDLENDKVANFMYKDTKFQLIKLFHAGPRETIAGFDIVCCMGVITNDSFHCHEYFFDHNERKRIHFNHLNYPLKTLYRIQKYSNYGYRMTRKQLVKLAKAMKLVNLTDDTQTDLTSYPEEEVSSSNTVSSVSFNWTANGTEAEQTTSSFNYTLEANVLPQAF